MQNPEFYGERAQQNSIKSVPIPGPRGRILDRDGRVIVDNHSSFSLLLARESAKDEHLRPIAQGLDLDYNDLVRRVERVRTQPKYVTATIKDELSPADLAFVASHHDFFPELVLIETPRRLYPQNGTLAHVIGYTGEISEQELDAPEFAKYNQGDVVGKFGIEKQYNDTLMGVDGQRQVVVDNRGQVRQTLATKKAVEGKDLQLTIDLDLQTVAELAMDGKNGAVVALDPRSGEVLAMVSPPDLRSEQVRGAHQDQGLARDRRQSGTSHAEPGDSGGAGAGIDVQADRGAGGPGDGNHRRKMDRALFRRRGALRPLPALLGSQGAWHAFAARRHRAFLRRFLLYPGRQIGYRQPLVLRRPGGLRTADRNRLAAREIRADAFGEMEAAQLPHQVVCRRDAVGGDRTGRADCDAAATGARHRRHRGGRQMVSAAHGQEADWIR